MNSRERLKKASAYLRGAGVPDPEYDSGMLLASITGKHYLELRADEIQISVDQEEAFQQLLEQRAQRVPLQYLLGTVWFMGMEFQVSSGVLIPRPETELLADWAKERLSSLESAAILDLCCGSGCLGISLAKLLPKSQVTLSDLSEHAIRISALNRERLGVDCEILQGDMFESVSGRRFDCVACNPPYISTDECDDLQPEVRMEPRMALDGGADGLDFYRRIAEKVREHLNPHGIAFLEVGCGQAEIVSEMLRKHGAARTEIRMDFSNIPRMVLGEYE